jgi:hypothetical protein
MRQAEIALSAEDSLSKILRREARHHARLYVVFLVLIFVFMEQRYEYHRLGTARSLCADNYGWLGH